MNTSVVDTTCDCVHVTHETGESCNVCSPNMVLTCKEEQILGKMRELKSDVRTITDRLSEIKGRFTNGGTPELHTLSNRLDELRAEWRDWSAKLDEAIEHKLIMLGHREPKT